jgi:hypothetical protein
VPKRFILTEFTAVREQALPAEGAPPAMEVAEVAEVLHGLGNSL